jgi:hypothetical protein
MTGTRIGKRKRAARMEVEVYEFETFDVEESQLWEAASSIRVGKQSLNA